MISILIADSPFYQCHHPRKEIQILVDDKFKMTDNSNEF